MSAVIDAVTALSSGADRVATEKAARSTIEEAVQRKQLSMDAVTYLRGRTFHRTFIIVDEAQNLAPGVLKTIITRAGTDTKVVLIGDVKQIDDPYLSENDNGLSAVIGAFAGETNFAHLRLERVERSDLAEQADRLMS
jgi:PhoH-like ATPase